MENVPIFHVNINSLPEAEIEELSNLIELINQHDKDSHLLDGHGVASFE
jgi:hypothetical protein